MCVLLLMVIQMKIDFKDNYITKNDKQITTRHGMLIYSKINNRIIKQFNQTYNLQEQFLC
jgi:hypothetical protein